MRHYQTRFHEFTEYHIAMVWDELHDRFGFNIEGWKKQFQDFLSKQSRGDELTDCFIIFGNGRINTILNDLLCRGSAHPTFDNLVEYVIRKK